LAQTPLLLQYLLALSGEAVLLFSFPSILRKPLLLRLLLLALALLIDLRLPRGFLLSLLFVGNLLLLTLRIQALLLRLLSGLPRLVKLLLPCCVLLPLLSVSRLLLLAPLIQALLLSLLLGLPLLVKLLLPQRLLLSPFYGLLLRLLGLPVGLGLPLLSAFRFLV
jgi:hypothetical protein